MAALSTAATGAPAHDSGPVGPRLVIQRAEVTVQVRQPAVILDQLGGLAEELGGYLERRRDQQAVLRVPSSRFRRALLRVARFGTVVRQQIESEEVTEQVQDLAARLRNAEAVRDRIVRLLAATRNIQEALQLERELARVTESVEVLKGKLGLISARVAHATVAVTVQPLPVVAPPPPPPPPPPVARPESPFGWVAEIGLGRLLNLPRRK